MSGKVVHRDSFQMVVEVNSSQVVVVSDLNQIIVRMNLFNLKSVKDTAKRQELKKYWQVFTPQVTEGDMTKYLSPKLRLEIQTLLIKGEENYAEVN